MKILSLYLTNFRGLDHFQITPNGRSVVFFGINGVGKSSILRAINLLYSSVINSVVKNRFKQGVRIEIEDISFGAAKCVIKFGVDICGKPLTYHRSMTRKTNERFHDKTALKAISDCFSVFVDDDDKDMPIYVNYSVNRSVIDVPLRIVKKHDFDKVCAFEKAIESRIDFRTFFEWFRNQEDLENQMIAQSNREYRDKKLDCVRTAILCMLDGFSNLRISRNPLRMIVNKENKTLRVDQLSDGEKCTLAMIGDLARRLAIANPLLEDPKKGEGVVLIDEIELHMHPDWQRKIIGKLRITFPNIQFIITTHSPQVLNEVNMDFDIYQLSSDNGKIVCSKQKNLVNWDANYILEYFMGASSMNIAANNNISQIYDLISRKEFVTATELVDKLESETDSAHEDVVKSRILIARGQANK